MRSFPRKKSSFRGAPAAFTNESSSSSNARSSSLWIFSKSRSPKSVSREKSASAGVSLFPCNGTNRCRFILSPLFQHTPPYTFYKYIRSISAAEGNGPINALDLALRGALTHFYPSLAQVRLTDYKVRVLESDATTAATVRVLIESTDGEHTWTTVGVSTDIIEASFLALRDSIEYKLAMDEDRQA